MIFGFEQRVWSAMQTLEDQVWAGKRIVVQLRAIWTVLWGGPVRLRQAQPESQNCVGEDEVAIDVGTLHPEEGTAQRIAPRISLPISSDTVDPKRCGFTETQDKTTKLQTFCQDPFLERIAEEKMRLRIRHFLRLSSQLMEEVG